MVPLGNLVVVQGGGTPSRSEKAHWNGEIPWVSPKDMKRQRISDAQEHVSASVVQSGRLSLVPAGSLLVVVRGMILVRAVPVALADVPLTINQDMKALACNGETEPEYLLSVLLSREQALLGKVSTAAHGTRKLDTKELLGLPIPLPPLDEQRRIVDLLNRAAGIRRLREQALATARNTIPALFLQTFGDPATNPNGWPVVQLGEVIAAFEGGKNIMAGDGASSPFRILKISAITGGVFRPDESKPAPSGYDPPPEHFVRKGDLMITRANTADLVGAVAESEIDHPHLLLPDKIWRFVWQEPSPVERGFIRALFETAAIRVELKRLATGTSDSMRNISQKKLKALPVPLPPLDLQRRFADRLADLRGIIAQQQAALAKARALERALLARLLG